MEKIILKLKLTFALAMTTALPLVAVAKPSMPKGVKYTVSPLVGYETVYRAFPTPHTSTRMMYGVRLTAGIDIASGELEYTRGSDTENYVNDPQSIKTEDDKLKLGIRSTYRFNEYLFATGRLGGQASKSTRTETTNGVSVTTEDPIKYNPYAGAHIGVNLGPLSISVGATAVIRDTEDMSKNDIQHTISFSIGN